MSGVSATPSSASTSRTISAVDDASGTIRFTSPKRLLSWWWSTSMTSRARSRTLWSGPSRSSFAQSSATSTSISISSGTSRRTSPMSRKRYSPGSGASPGRYIVASLPSPRRASAVPSIEPRASPSGFSWPATRNLSYVRNASATARSSVWVIRSVVDEFVDQLRHANPTLDGGIVFEGELRGPFQVQLACDPPLQEAVRRLEPLEARTPLPRATEHRDEDAALAQVRRHVDAGDSDEADPRVLEVRYRFRDHRTHRLVHPPHSLAHRGPHPPPRSYALEVCCETGLRRGAREQLEALVVRRHERPLAAHQLPFLAREPRLRARGELVGRARVARDQGGRQRAALPELVMVDLRDRRAEAVCELRLRRLHVLPLALQRPCLREVQLDRDDCDEARAQDWSAAVPAGTASSSDVRSTSRVSNTSKMSPSRRSLKPSSRMPHSKPSTTSRASSLKRLSCATVVSWISAPSRKMRTFAPRRTRPLVTMQPAIVPSRETRKSARTSTSPITASVETGESMPTSACSMSRVSS